MGEEACSWDLKNNIRSVILDWRKISAGHSSEGERSVGLSSKGRDPLVIHANLSAPPYVFSGRSAHTHKGSPPQKKDMCELSLWLYSYFTQTSPSKNKNTNYIFIYLRVLRCLSSGTICDRSMKLLGRIELTYPSFANLLVNHFS